MSCTEVSLSQKWRLLCVNALVFLICYQGASHYAASVRTYSLAFDFEAHIPFVPLLILPYMTLSLVLAASFLCMKKIVALQTLSRSILLATVVAGICFVCFPAKFTSQAPITDTFVLSQLQMALLYIDRPFNQLPSLHVAYAVILISTLSTWVKNLWLRLALGAWLCLSALSTIFVYQHHVLDFLGGLALGVLSIYATRSAAMATQSPPVVFYYLIASGCCFVLGILFLPNGFTFYLCSSLCLVSFAYCRQNRHFLHKTNGRHPWWVRILYAPYLIGYFLTWLYMRNRQSAKNQPTYVQYTTQLWAGRTLTRQEVSALPSNCTVIDLSPELCNHIAASNHRYIHVPILDIVQIPSALVLSCCEAIHNVITSKQMVYLHCAMGFSRSQAIAKHYIELYPQHSAPFHTAP